MQNEIDKKITIRMVAEAAGVSPATAYNVLSGKRQLSTPAGRKVLECAEALGFSKGTNKKFKNVIHFVLYKKHGKIVMDTPFFTTLMQGIEKTCRANKFALSMSYIDCVNNKDSEVLIRKIVEDSETPLLLLATEMQVEDLKVFTRRKGPMVVLDNLCTRFPFNSVVIDNFMAGFMAGNHFIDRGHTDMGIITPSLYFHNALNRESGFSLALRVNSLQLEEKNIFRVIPTMEEAAAELTAIFRAKKGVLPSALFAINDLLAFAAYQALQEVGCKIPDDVSLIGVDNLPFGTVLTPRLTTIDVSKEQLGSRAVERLIELTKNTDSLSIKQTFGVSLIERESVRKL